METCKIQDMLSAESLLELQNIVGRRERHEKYAKKTR